MCSTVESSAADIPNATHSVFVRSPLSLSPSLRPVPPITCLISASVHDAWHFVADDRMSAQQQIERTYKCIYAFV